ncbi:hypothetical protein D9615_004934 [Tricholomella constricta]|uniref:Uncharacterized protein n=1 Tax=Tricholomella constricta TaxID=117010 RepID=A0A8H5HH13_9AGAR|nr:hypothetical protein D9615_004934 [Tricholomella constricta]
MALSVSGFPEPLRQVTTGDADAEPSLLSNNARLRGLFGKKNESKPIFRQNTDESHGFLTEMDSEPLPPISPIPHHRQRQISITRRTPPPIKRQPSLGRLDIGSAPRLAPAMPKPPTVVVHEPSLAHPRPLPAVPTPGPIIESSKSAAMRAAASPASKVLMSSASRPRAQTTAPHAVSVRYLSMPVDPTESDGASPAVASSSSSSPHSHTANQIRPLPRIPPASASSHLLPPHVPRPARVKRPKTSPSSSAGFGSAVRSPFDAVPSSWASRPVDLNPSQPVASTSKLSPVSTSSAGPRSLPRPRSHSRSRRDQVDRSAIASGSRSASAASPIRRLPTSTPSTPTPVRLPARRTSAKRVSGYSSASPTTSPRLGLTSPPNRFLADRGIPSTSKIDEESASIRSQTLDLDSDPARPSTDSHSRHELEHRHPPLLSMDAGDDDAEPYIDDLHTADYSSMLSRSPSPMRYARPSSRGSLSFSDDDYPYSHSRSRSRTRAPRGQLRAFRRSYRAPPQPASRSPSPIAYARRHSFELDMDLDRDVGLGGDMVMGLGLELEQPAQKRHTQPRSYQFDYGVAQEEKERKEGKEGKEGGGGSGGGWRGSGSSKSMKRSKSKGSNSRTHSSSHTGSGAGEQERPSRSRSPRPSHSGSVLDISSPSTASASTASYHDLPHQRYPDPQKAKAQVQMQQSREEVQGKPRRSVSIPFVHALRA